MKTLPRSRTLLLSASLVIGHWSLLIPAAQAAKEPEPPVPVSQGATPAARAIATETPSHNQRVFGPGETVIPMEKARAVGQAFRATNDKLGKPRYLIYVNRDLVENSGLKLSGRTERTESTRNEAKSAFEADPNAPKPDSANPQTQINVAVGGGDAGSGREGLTPGKGSADATSSKITAENTYTATDTPQRTLADRQTTREVERLLGRHLRLNGAKLADQKTAAALIADRPLDHFTAPSDDTARKDREALAKVADVVIEMLVSTRPARVANVSGDEVVNIPDIQVTAIRLTDSAIIGQASSTDILGKDQYAGPMAKKFDIREITEAVAFALMEDINLTTN